VRVRNEDRVVALLYSDWGHENTEMTPSSRYLVCAEQFHRGLKALLKKKYGDGLKKYRKDIDCYYTSAFFQIEKDGKVKTFYLYVPDHRLVPMGYRDVLFREARDMQDYAGYQNNNIHIYNFPMEMYSLIDSSFEEEEE